jgi:hypothetical protein
MKKIEIKITHDDGSIENINVEPLTTGQKIRNYISSCLSARATVYPDKTTEEIIKIASESAEKIYGKE